MFVHVTLFLCLLMAFAQIVVTFHFPLELEVRESTVWLHILASKAGINPYDSTKVAFINMVYGPLEALLKGFVHWTLPFLDSFEVIRIFVPLLPLSYVLVAYGWMRESKQRLMDALLAAIPIYLIFSATDAMAILIGRPDATAGVWTNLVLFLIAPWAREKITARRRGELYWTVAVAFFLSLTFHTSWRFFPLPFLLTVGCLAGYRRPKSVMTFLRGSAREWGTLVAVGAVVSLVIILYVFGFDFGEYYRRYWGIFTAASGWGSFPANRIYWMPGGAIGPGQIYWAVALATLASLFWMERQRKDELQFWIGAGLLMWLLQVISYRANGVGGGLRYFFPGLTFFWIAGMHFFPKLEARVPRWREIHCAVIWVGLPWLHLWGITNHYWVSYHHGAFINKELRGIPRNDDFVSDGFHLFKTEWKNDVIDTPDIAVKVAATGYFGPDYTKRVEEHFNHILASPPRLLLHSFIDDERVSRMLKAGSYRKVLEAPEHNLGNGMRYPAQLYEKLQPK